MMISSREGHLLRLFGLDFLGLEDHKQTGQSALSEYKRLSRM